MTLQCFLSVEDLLLSALQQWLQSIMASRVHHSTGCIMLSNCFYSVYNIKTKSTCRQYIQIFTYRCVYMLMHKCSTGCTWEFFPLQCVCFHSLNSFSHLVLLESVNDKTFLLGRIQHLSFVWGTVQPCACMYVCVLCNWCISQTLCPTSHSVFCLRGSIVSRLLIKRH